VTRSGRPALVALSVAGMTAACGSTRPAAPVSGSVTTTTTASAPTTTSSLALQVTVPDCGAGAYRPTTLLIVCASGGTMATGIQWTSWSAAGASGVGTVHLQGGAAPAAAQADLALSDVMDNGSAGPQFTHLTVSWIGRSPDGHTSDSFELGNGA
jgi:hypothetical protein